MLEKSALEDIIHTYTRLTKNKSSGKRNQEAKTNTTENQICFTWSLLA